jgi:hypothetical protein
MREAEREVENLRERLQTVRLGEICEKKVDPIALNVGYGWLRALNSLSLLRCI